MMGTHSFIKTLPVLVNLSKNLIKQVKFVHLENLSTYELVYELSFQAKG